MYQVSAAFLAAIQASHTPVARIEVWSGHGPNDTKLLSSLAFVTASVSVDATAEQRRQLTVNFTDTDGTLAPGVPGDLLAPYGRELRAFRGIRYTNGTQELVPLGCFPLTETSVQWDGASLPVDLTAPDRSQLVQAAKSTDFYGINTGTNVATAIQALLSSRVSGLTYNLEPTAFTTAVFVVQPGDDPWKAALAIAASAGQDLAFDATGVVVSRTLPDPATTIPSVSYVDGALNVLTSSSKKLTVTDTYNVIVVTTEGPNSTVPVLAIAQDNDPASPTYVNGPLGQRVKTVKSDQATTTAQAQAIANAELNKSLGLTQQVSFEGVVNPATDAYDVVSVTQSAAKISGRYVIDKVDIPLTWNDLMSIETRARSTSS